MDRIEDPVGWLRRLVSSQGLEGAFGVFPGVYRAICTSNADPQSRGRVQFMCPAIGQFGPDHVLPDLWALPAGTGLSGGYTEDGKGMGEMKGLFFPPEINDQIWVMFEGGDPASPVYMGGWLRDQGDIDWNADYMNGVSMRSEDDAPVKKRGIRTVTGHSIVFDDESASIIISRGEKSGDDPAENPGDLVIIQDNQIVVSTSDGCTLTVGDGTITALAEDSSMMTIGKDAFALVNGSGTTISGKGTGISMTADGDINLVAAGGINLNSGSVQLGKGPVFESAVTGDSFAISFQTHMHSSTVPGTPTSPTVAPPLVPGNGLATGVKISKT